MRVLSEADVLRLVDREDAIACAAEAYRREAQGGTLRHRGDVAQDDPKAACLLLVGADGAGHLTVKSNVHAYPDGPMAPRLWGSVLTLWDWRRARPRALISARAFNDHRTATGFAVGIRVLAPLDATRAAVFGAGKSAPEAIRYLRAARPSLRHLALVGRSPARVAALAEAVRAWPDFADVTVTTPSPAQAVAEADIVVTVTTSDVPVFPGAAVKPGSCVVLGGANKPGSREVDADLMRRADVYCDARRGALEKAGDLVLALAEGSLAPARIVTDIGACDGPLPFSPGADVRVFKSMGLPIQDVLLAERIVTRAEALGIGTIVDLEGA